MADLQKIVDELSKLTLREATDLAKMLRERWSAGALLFDDRKRTRTDPLGLGESLFTFYDECGRHGYDEFRSVVNGWLAKMPAADRDELMTRMRDGGNREFGASLTELASHAFILGLGYRASAHPEISGTKKRPDFAATDQQGTETLAYIEVTTVNPPSAEKADRNRENSVYNAIDRAEIPAGSALGYSLVRAAKNSPPLKRLVSDVERWAADNAETAKTEEVSKTFTVGDWTIELDLYSGGTNPDPGVHAIGVVDMGGGIISPHKDLRAALETKSKRYGALDKPYLIIVADGKEQLFSKDSIKSALIEAVLGDEIVQFRGGVPYTIAWLGDFGDHLELLTRDCDFNPRKPRPGKLPFYDRTTSAKAKTLCRFCAVF